VRFVDIVFIHKEEDGAIRTVELNDLDPEAYEMFVPMGEHVSSLFTNDDLEIAARKLPNGSAALLICGKICGSPICARPCGSRRPTGRSRPDRARSSRGVCASHEAE
jgi:hypothetical protein